MPKVAKRLGCSDETVRRYISEGRLRGFQRMEGGWWLIFASSVIEFEAALRRKYLPENGEQNDQR